jgi:gluconokinase
MLRPLRSPPPTLILMGVCGCGKTLIGQNLAKELGGIFEDADDFHPPPSKAKMTAGIPLTDDDRWPWLRILRARIEEMRGQTSCYILACSALKQVYRDILRGSDSRDLLEFVHLKGSRELIGSRMAARKGHYMPTSLIDSQFAILEEPQDAITVDVSGSPEAITHDVLTQLTTITRNS